jgi:hypothetical protein
VRDPLGRVHTHTHGPASPASAKGRGTASLALGGTMPPKHRGRMPAARRGRVDGRPRQHSGSWPYELLGEAAAAERGRGGHGRPPDWSAPRHGCRRPRASASEPDPPGTPGGERSEGRPRAAALAGGSPVLRGTAGRPLPRRGRRHGCRRKTGGGRMPELRTSTLHQRGGRRGRRAIGVPAGCGGLLLCIRGRMPGQSRSGVGVGVGP